MSLTDILLLVIAILLAVQLVLMLVRRVS